MSSMYIVVYSECDNGWVSSERKTGICTHEHLVSMLREYGSYTIWSACWVNPDIDNIEHLERL